MIKALLLLVRPETTWDGIDRSARSITYILCLHLLPLIILTSVAQGYGLIHWGKMQKAETSFVKTYTLHEAVVIETAYSLLLLGMAFLIAYAAMSFAATFHRRHTFRHAFTAVAYGFAPMLTLRLGDLSSTLTPWIPWATGLVLTIGVLYYGLPCIMKPDPPHAFGLFFMTSLTLTVVSGLLCLLTSYFFLGRFPALEKAVTALAGGMPS